MKAGRPSHCGDSPAVDTAAVHERVQSLNVFDAVFLSVLLTDVTRVVAEYIFDFSNKA